MATSRSLSVAAVAAVVALAMAAATAARPPTAAEAAATLSASVPYCSDPTKYNKTLDGMLIASTDMPAQISSMVVAVPTSVLVEYIFKANFVDWNPLFNTQATPPENVTLCGSLDAVYSNGQFLGPILPKNIIGPHYIVQKGCTPSCAGGKPDADADPCTCAFGWFFTINLVPSNEIVTYGRHTYTFEMNADNTTTVSSYERAAGKIVAAHSQPWTNALQESLIQGVQGMVCLERQYQEKGELDVDDVAAFCRHFIA
mmetsp:Transcript_4890/g.17737  ORF Transcript_4890/g.17737 Transcript_4890/m.17737 type:complete len:257 (-) Transcript_4890:173-943(-)